MSIAACCTFSNCTGVMQLHKLKYYVVKLIMSMPQRLGMYYKSRWSDTCI